MISCEKSGNEPSHHFAGAGKPITGGKGAVQVVNDYQLSRFACYLIAQNGDPRKTEIANAQKYFAAKENLLDRMGTTELAANQFRMTQTRDKLARERVHDQHQAKGLFV